jgi:hypothetical protein
MGLLRCFFKGHYYQAAGWWRYVETPDDQEVLWFQCWSCGKRKVIYVPTEYMSMCRKYGAYGGYPYPNPSQGYGKRWKEVPFTERTERPIPR